MAQPSAAQKFILGPQCWGCREKRVRCGSEMPGCAKCAAKGVACPGYGATKPLRWRKPQNPRALEGKRSTVNSFVIDFPPRFTLTTPAEKSLDSVIADEIIYYNERIAPDLVVVDLPSNPFRWSLKLSAIAPAYLNQAYAAISSFHRIVQRRYGGLNLPQSGSIGLTAASTSQRPDPEEAMFYRHYASALRSLNDELSKTTKTLNITILAGVMMLLFSQLQQAAYGQWRVHLDGFKHLIDFYGGWRCLLARYLDAGFVLSNLVIIDAMSTTTSPVTNMGADTIRWHTTYLEILPYLDYDVIPIPTPIPPPLLRAVIMINLARAASHTTRERNQCTPTLSQVLDELGITLFSECASGGDTYLLEGLEYESRVNNHDTIVGTPSQALFTNCYRSAVILYAMEAFTALDTDRDNPLLDALLTTEAANAIQTSAYDSLMHSLRALFQLKDKPQGGEAHWKFIFWPLALAGVQSVVLKRDRNDFNYICARLYEMTAELGTLCMRDAAVFLRRLWLEASASESNGRLLLAWDEIFKEAPLFLL
ncbi:fungal-specific transcription factor domain-containing protein [Aspergillus spectabilis]